jgi:hypothetical protein
VIKPRRMRWARHIACVGEMRNAYNILVGKPDKKRLLRKPIFFIYSFVFVALSLSLSGKTCSNTNMQQNC